MRVFCDNIRRFIERYGRAADLVEILLLAFACVLAINTLSESAWITITFGALYLAFLVIKIWLNLSERRAIDRLQGEVLWGLFDMMNDNIFGGNCHVRFTLFRIDPIRPTYIIPWYRYEKAGHHPINAAQRSNARYRRGEGYTGRAWQEAGQNSFEFAFLPVFANRQQFEDYYVNSLGIEQSVVRDVSDYMTHTGVILSCGFSDTRGRFLGVLSIDLQWSLIQENPARFRDIDGAIREFSTNSLATIWMVTHNVLRSFAHALRS
jgi:hypothetical protein